MKIKLMSDLHIEFGYVPDYLKEEKDVTLVLAGDLDSNVTRLAGLIDEAAEKYKHVIFVAGNHDFYHGEYFERLAMFEEIAGRYDNVHFLEKDFIKIDDVTFLGGTSWSVPNWGVFNMIADREYIKFKGKNLNSDNISDIFYDTQNFIVDGLEKIEGKKVVVTHFGPDQILMHPRWQNHTELNTYFWGKNYNDHFHLADMWLFGHTHDPQDMVIDGCRCVCNPHGYVFRNNEREHWNFNRDLILEI
jgi:predicted phosphodiesterase